MIYSIIQIFFYFSSKQTEQGIDRYHFYPFLYTMMIISVFNHMLKVSI